MALTVDAPALSCPFVPAVHPRGELVTMRSIAWLARHGVATAGERLGRLRRARSGERAARTNPFVADDMLQLVSDWYLWLHALAVEHGDPGRGPAELLRAVSRLLPVLEDACPATAAGGDGFALGLRDLRRRVAEAATPTQLGRWIASIHDHFLGRLWEAAQHAAGAAPDLGECTVMRRPASATPTCLALVDVAGRFDVPAAEWDAPAVRLLSDLAVDVVGWDHDILSFERRGDGGGLNLVAVAARHFGCPLEDALELAVHLRNLCIADYQHEEPLALAGASAALGRYVEGLRYWMRGHLDWTLSAHGSN